MDKVMENLKYFILGFLFSILLFSVFLVQNVEKVQEPKVGIINKVRIPIVAVVDESNGKITHLYNFMSYGYGRVFVNNYPPKDFLLQFSIEFSKDLACTLIRDCDNYDYYIIFDGLENTIAKGPSAGLPIAVSFLSLLKGEEINNYASTGFVTPNGLVLPVGGLKEKEKAAMLKTRAFVIPNCNNLTDEYYKIFRVGDVLEAYKIFTNKSLVPDKRIDVKRYKELMRKIAFDICRGIKNETVSKLLSESRYYSAASICFGIKSNNLSYMPDISEEELKKKITNLKDQVNSIKCEIYNCYEIKGAVLSRLKESEKKLSKYEKNKDKKILLAAYWRYDTAKHWLEFINLTTDREIWDFQLNVKKIEDLLKTFETQGVRMENLEVEYYPVEGPREYYENKETLAKLELGLASMLCKNRTLLTWNIRNLTEKYLKIFGPSVTSLAYLEYSESLEEIGDIDSSLYYAELALVYSLP